jgi:hypothetical protein
VLACSKHQNFQHLHSKFLGILDVTEKIDLVLLQSKFFPAKFIFYRIMEKGILAGKKFT